VRIGIDYTAAVNQTAGIGRFVRGLVRAVAALDQENQYVLVHAAPRGRGVCYELLPLPPGNGPTTRSCPNGAIRRSCTSDR